MASVRRASDRSAGRPGTAERGRRTGPSPARNRFRDADPYRAEREWTRYEGTAQRELWRTLRERFLVRHAVASAWALDLGSGPGRFTRVLGDPTTHRVALDVSTEMLRSARRHEPPAPASGTPSDLVRADGRLPPFLPESFGTVAVLGNTLGFAGNAAGALQQVAVSLVAPGGLLLLEVAPGPGERSRYLARLPPTSLARLLRAPVRALIPRVGREGFDTMPFRKSEEGEFRRMLPEEVCRALPLPDWEVREVQAVAPSLGPLASRIEQVRSDPKAWEHLLELEEEVGRQPERWKHAAAVLIAARSLRPPMGRIK